MTPLLALMATVIAPVVTDPISKLTDRREKAYRRCVGAASLRMSSSPERAPVVAKAALTACLPQRGAFEDSILADLARGRPDMSVEAARKDVSRLLVRVDKQFRDYATYVVTEARSGK